ncbi:BREX-1 system adenine-specific DNA-methyltransferase PglX [Flavobacteriaceae bacterium]|nr:BREX-1 system adenine-specific DNA-methyltransferase PglX [Flavobacteriaceae bacterium]
MPIFQKSIVDKYLDTLDAGVLDKAYDSYKEVYSAQKIQRIKKLKEEQYQGGFLKDIFGSVLGYTIDPEVGYNIELEKKNETNSKKADGAIVQDEKVLGVIELKSNTTKNLESIKDQAFGYKNNHKGCKYVISSNFHKLRFYVDDATEYEEFDLYNLDKETFKKFYLYLRKEGLLDKNIPKLLKEETKFHEENISKQLYKDYSSFKNKFFENIVKNNPQYDKLLLFKKSQKFLDRILFVLFAEDKELIPTNAISKIVESWTFADDLHYKPLYELFTILFEHLNVGHIYKSGYEIPAYNGGLFAPDEVLDNLKVDDKILKDDLLTLSKYDFNTDVDVNILGHIFEHSLSEIEEIEAELKGEVADKSKSKRKKEGVFYTPKYITKYIVDNTLGKLCTEKKEELGLDIDFDVQDYQKSNGPVNAKGKDLFHTLEAYKEWLLQLKILDPACGSGAFLNQALTFLIEEHKNIDDLIAELTNSPLRIFDTDKAILENNIFGVDINDESVEIAKLSLWLRTAQKGRKLSNLNNNIKCGNSLIDDPSVAGDKAFKWRDEFVNVFSKGGFDVVIGNPPYVSHDRVDNKKYLSATYESHQGFADLFCYFYELGVKLLKRDGVLSFITSNSFLKAEYGAPLRKFLLNNSTLLEIINVEDAQMFSDAIVNSSILSLQKNSFKNQKCLIVNKKYDLAIDFWSYIESNKFYYKQLDFDELPWNLIRPEILKLRNKIKGKKLTLEELNTKIRLGLATGSNEAFIVTEEIKRELITQDQNSIELIKPMLRGKDIEQYYYNLPPLYLLLTKNGIDVQRDYPAIYNHLDSFGDSFKKRGAKGKHWTNLRACSFFDDFKKDKIVWIELTDKGRFSKCSDEIYLLNSAYFLLPPKGYSIGYLITLLNSKLIKFYLKQIANTSGVGTARWINIYVKEFPIYEANIEIQTECDNLEKTIKNKLISLKNINKAFTKYLQSQINLEKLSRKLQNWYELEFGDFITELNKSIKKAGGEKLTKIDEMEWMDVFETKKEEAQGLKSEIDKTDKEIDKMVYELYDLTEEEIQIVENS